MSLKKKILIILVSVLLIFSVAIFYLNEVILPTKIKALIINTLTEQTKTKVSLEAVKFNIFKGLVLKNLTLSDDTKQIASIKEASVVVLLLPIVFKKVIIPKININSAQIFLERKADNTFNLRDLIPKATSTKSKFSLFVYSISINTSRIIFQDDTLSPAFTKNIENVEVDLSVSLPAAIKFSLKADVPGSVIAKIKSTGEFKLFNKQFSAKVLINNLAPREFIAYYQGLGISFPQGTIDTLANIGFKDGVLSANLEMQNNNLAILKNKINAKLNSKVTVKGQYALNGQQLKYEGQANIIKSDVSGVDFVNSITDIAGLVLFNESGASSELIKANTLGLPVEAKLNLSDFRNPLLKLEVISGLGADDLKRILKDKFQTVIPADIQGKARVYLGIESALVAQGTTKINGYLDISSAKVKLDKINAPFEEITGRLQFTPDQLKWQDLNFKYLSIPYKTSGNITNFKAPNIQFGLVSKDLSLDSAFALEDKTIDLSKFSGRYLNSEFSFTGKVDLTDTANLFADVKGAAALDLKDSRDLFKKYQAQLDSIKPSGKAIIQFSLNGNVNNFKTLFLEAKITSPLISAYGLQSGEFVLNYSQADGIINIPLYSLALYDGLLQGGASVNLNSENLPYWFSTVIQGVKIEKLKNDTLLKDKKGIAGTLNAELKINGFSDDLSKLSGAGRISITEGKLWELNLFKGLGQVLFVEDFARIVFSEGSCAFVVQDKSVFTDSLKLASLLTELTGSVRIGFDSSIDATLDVHVNEEVPLTGTFKDVTTAIIGQAGRFGIITISGTLKEPKYKFKTDVGDLIGVLKDTFFKKQ